MKKYLKILLPLLFLGVLGYFGNQIVTKINHKKEIANNIKIMPSFTYQDVKGNTFTNKNLNPNMATVFFYYNSDCDFCNHEAQMVQKNMAKFKNYQLVFVSFEKPAKVKTFAQQYKLDICDNVTFAVDTQLTFASTFDVKSLPSIVIYDENNALVKQLKGQVKPEKIIELLTTN